MSSPRKRATRSSESKPQSAGPTALDLFAGCGGMTAGFVAEGFDPRLAVEWEVPAGCDVCSELRC